MTTPRQAKKRSSDGPRIYAWPPQPPHEFEVISVTSALKGGLPKPYLIGWAAKVAAECAWDDFEVLKLLHEKKQQRSFIDHVKGARNRDSGGKADRGTVVHAAVEAYIAGGIDRPREIHRLGRTFFGQAMRGIRGENDARAIAQPREPFDVCAKADARQQPQHD